MAATTGQTNHPSDTKDQTHFDHLDSVMEHEKAAASDNAERDYTGVAKKTDPEEIRLVRKLDIWIMPCLCLMYFLNYVDRNAIAQARLNDLEEDLGMTGTEFNTTVSILFVGYVLMQIPSNMLITKVKPGIYMSAWMLVWAAVSACTALVKNYEGLLVCRFFLGVTEAPFYPGATYMLSIFYTRKEVAARIAILYCAQILATGFSGLIAAGIFAGMDDLKGLEGWRWLFIIEGAVTAVVSIGGFFLLPNTPLTTWWLSDREKQLAHSRMEKDKLSDSDDKPASAWEGLKQACADKRTWLFCLMQNFHLSACSFNSFFPTVIKTLGFNTTVTLVMTCPPFIFAGAAGIAFGWSSGRFHERTWHITAGLATAIVGFVLAAATLNTAARYVACFIFAMGAYSVNSVIIGWASSTLSQTKEKKAVVLAMTNVGGQIGYIYGAYLWPKSDSPRYGIGFGASAGFALFIDSLVVQNYYGTFFTVRVFHRLRHLHVHPQRRARDVALFLQTSSYAGYIVFYSWIASSSPRPPAKCAVAIAAIINAFAQLGNVAGSYFWDLKENRCRKSYGIVLSMFGITIVGCCIVRLMLADLNKQLEKGEAESDEAQSTSGDRPTGTMEILNSP